jgi:16S rRNA (guanine527-N7)-methyltransferase
MITVEGGMPELTTSLLAAVRGLSGELDAEGSARLEAYAGMLRGGARRMGLMSRSAAARVGEQIVDSAAVLQVLQEPVQEVADLGAGGGLPGIVIAILRPSWRIVAIDARRSKVAFLKSVTRELNLRNVEVVHTRIASLAARRRFPVALSRALGNVAETLPTSLDVVDNGGRLVLYKGSRWLDERALAVGLAAARGASLEREVAVELPGLGRRTTFVVFHVERHEPDAG